MSWLARSIANSLRIDDDDDGAGEDDVRDHNRATTSTAATANSQHEQRRKPNQYGEGEGDEDEDESNNQGRGVREDLSEIRETLSRQLWGVASFLAPLPQPHSNPAVRYPNDQTDCSVSDRNRLDSSVHCGSADDPDEEDAGFVGDSADENGFAYIQNRIRSGISRDSSFLHFRPDDEIAIGVTEEVLTFAGNIAHHPETWLDFPLEEEEEMDDFEMSEAQCKHAIAVERLAPRLAALRIELCPAHMSEGYFWKVYFVLLHSRLNKHDDELLSTPQILAARAMWMQELQKQTKSEPVWLRQNTSFYSTRSANSLHEDFDDASSDSPYGNTPLGESHFASTAFAPTKDFHTEDHPFVASDQIIDKSVIKEEPVLTTDKEIVASSSYKLPIQDYDDDDGDSWFEENSDLDGYNGAAIHLGNDEDVSFSDLEDDDDLSFSTKPKAVTKDSGMSANTS